MKHPCNPDPDRRGLTLIELLISITILALLLGGAVGLTRHGIRGYEGNMAENLLLGRTARCLQSVMDMLVGVGANTLNPPDPRAPLGTDSLDYQTSLGWQGGAVQWSPVRRLAFELEPNELDNGIDDDGDGYVDEGQIVIVENPAEINESRRVLARGVARYYEGEIVNGLDDNGNGVLDEAGFSFEARGDLLIVRLSLLGIDAQGITHTRSFESSISPRHGTP